MEKNFIDANILRRLRVAHMDDMRSSAVATKLRIKEEILLVLASEPEGHRCTMLTTEEIRKVDVATRDAVN
jgi:hypothetical protein